jgi:hypothetical protein
MLKFSKIISSKSKIIFVKDNSEYLRNIPFWKKRVTKPPAFQWRFPLDVHLQHSILPDAMSQMALLKNKIY